MIIISSVTTSIAIPALQGTQNLADIQKYICVCLSAAALLTTEAVECSSLSLESIDDVKRCDCLPLGVLGVCDGISDD